MLGESKGRVLFTWDDGYDSWRDIAEMAHVRGHRHTFCVSLNRIGLAGFADDDIVAIHRLGHEIAAHSVTHTKVTSQTPGQRAVEYDDSKSYLEDLIGEAVTTWAYPYGGASNPPGRDATTDAECYLRFDRLLDTTGYPGTAVFDVGDAPFLIPRINAEPSVANLRKHGIDWIRRAGVEPIIVGLYGHDVAGRLPEIAEMMDAASEVGAECVTAAEAFPAYSSHLLDGGFEDPTMAHWAVGGSADQTAESIADTPMAGMPGSRSLHLATTGTDRAVFVSQGCRMRPGLEYTLSFRNRVAITGSGTGAKVYAKIEQYDRDFTLLSNFYSAPNLTNTAWAKNTLVAPAHASARFAIVKFVIENLHGDAWFDHVDFAPTRDGVFG